MTLDSRIPKAGRFTAYRLDESQKPPVIVAERLYNAPGLLANTPPEPSYPYDGSARDKAAYSTRIERHARRAAMPRFGRVDPEDGFKLMTGRNRFLMWDDFDAHYGLTPDEARSKAVQRHLDIVNKLCGEMSKHLRAAIAARDAAEAESVQ